MAHVSGIRSRLALSVALVVACGGLAAGLGDASQAEAAAHAGPAAGVSPGPGCPANVRAWIPRETAPAAGDPQELAPGSLSAAARAAFGTAAARLLAGHRVRWLRGSGCVATHARSVPAQARRTEAGPRTAGQLAAAPAAAPVAASAAAPSAATAPNWSGYESDAGSFTGVSMVWSVPSVARSSPIERSSVWPGIGNANGPADTLIQAGTESDSDGNIYPWFEVLPEPQENVVGFLIGAGDLVGVNVGWDPGSHVASFLLVNYTTGQALELSQTLSRSVTSGDSAEWVVERTEYGVTTGVYSPLAQFGQVTIHNGFAQQTKVVNGLTQPTTGDYIQGFGTLKYIDMTNCLDTQTLAEVPATLDPNGTFTDTWKAAGPSDPEDCTWDIAPQNAAFTLSGPITSLPPAMVVTDKRSGLAISCRSATLSGTTEGSPQDQSGPVPATLATIDASKFTNCLDPNNDSWTATEPAGLSWDVNADSADGDGHFTGDLTNVSLLVSGTWAGQACAFTLIGSVPAGDLTWTNPGEMGIAGASLAVSGPSGPGCGAAGVQDEDTVTMSATWAVTSPSSGISVTTGKK